MDDRAGVEIEKRAGKIVLGKAKAAQDVGASGSRQGHRKN